MARHEYYIRCRTENEWECENPLNNVIFLQDEYDKYWNKIKSGDNFAFSRYADEEYALMIGRAVRAQEGWHVGNEITLLGKRLLETLTPPQAGMVYGISCPCCDSEAYYWYLYHISNAGISFSNIWNTKNFQKFMNDFSALERDAVLITNYRGVGKEYGKLHIIRHYAVDDDCVNFYENGYDSLVEKISGEIGERKNLLYAVSAGPLSGIIIWELFKRNPENCYVDFGSALDIFTHGRITRPFMNESNPLNKKKCWMFANDSTQTDVDVVLTAYKRPDALQIQLDAVLNQTLKPKHVFLYQDGIDSYYSINFKQEILEKLDDYHVSDTNGGVWKRFEYARKVAQSKYVCVFDDDTIPGRRWLENCHIHMMQHQGIYGSNGFLLSDFDYPYKSGGIHVGWHVPNELAAEVDFSGHSWFFEKEWLEWMLAKDYRHKYKYVGEDMGLSFACKEKGKRTYVPSHPESILSLWGSLPHYGNKFGGSGAPVSENNNNLLAMNHALQEYHADGWTPIFEDDPGYVEKMRLFELKIRYWEKDGHIDISSNEEMEQKVLQSMERFKSAKLTHDILQIAFALLSAKPIMVLSKLRESRERAEFVESFLRVFIWGAFLTIKQGNHSLALAFLTAIKETYLLLQEVEPIIVSFCEGLVYYYRQEYAMAEQCFIQYLGSFPRNEEAFFYLGNAAAYQNAIERASEAYNNALMIKKNYTEVFENVELLSSLVEQKIICFLKKEKLERILESTL